MFNLLLKNAQVVDPLNGVNDVCDVAVENGVIAEARGNVKAAENPEDMLAALRG